MKSNSLDSNADIARLSISLIDRAYVMLNEYLAIIGAPCIEVPELLTHYSSESVCRLIIESQNAYLFDATTSNDITERIHGIEIMWDTFHDVWKFSIDEAESLCSTIDDPTEINLLRLNVIGRLMRRSLLSADKELGVILCMSGSYDNLTMWREYGGDGTGASIVFRSSDIAEQVRGTITGLFPVIYNDSYKRVITRFLAVAVYELYEERANEIWTKQVAELYRHVSAKEVFAASSIATELLSFLFKDISFEYEQESRLIHLVQANDSLVFKDLDRGRERRYVNWSKIRNCSSFLPIHSVYIGPRMTKSNEQKKILDLCQAFNIDVIYSKLPYRGSDAPRDIIGKRLSAIIKHEKRRVSAERAILKKHPDSQKKRNNMINNYWNELDEIIRLNKSRNVP